MDREYFGRHLRELRQRAGLSQEALARRLGVSPQSVSKWELAANLPETDVLLPLARLLGVSTDELLASPVSREAWEARWQAARKEGDHFALLAAAEAALRELPEDREWRFRQANEEYQVAALTEDPSERGRLLSLSEGHFSALLRDHPGYEEAGVMLVQVLMVLGRRREAEALAERLPGREKLQLLLRQGKARAEALRQVITRSVFELLNLLFSEGSPAALEMAGAILGAAGPDRQLVYYRMDLRRLRAAQLCRAGERSAALSELNALLACAAGEDGSSGEAAFLLPTLEEGSPEERRRWVLEALEEEAFASLRETPEFQALREQASKSAWK